MREISVVETTAGCNSVGDDAWMRGGTALAALLGGSADQAAQLYHFRQLAQGAWRVAVAQPSLVRVRSPAKVFGDVHGQLRDLLALFAAFGFPGHMESGDVESVSYVFNGDFVDRGALR